LQGEAGQVGTAAAAGLVADVVRLWPTLARFDLSYNPLGKISERRLTSYPNLWGYARDLYQRPAFRETTDFAAFGRLVAGPRPSFVNDAPWRIDVEPAFADRDSPHHRGALAG
jgi:putative glutathione S-transferase